MFQPIFNKFDKMQKLKMIDNIKVNFHKPRKPVTFSRIFLWKKVLRLIFADGNVVKITKEANFESNQMRLAHKAGELHAVITEEISGLKIQ